MGKLRKIMLIAVCAILLTVLVIWIIEGGKDKYPRQRDSERDRAKLQAQQDFERALGAFKEEITKEVLESEIAGGQDACDRYLFVLRGYKRLNGMFFKMINDEVKEKEAEIKRGIEMFIGMSAGDDNSEVRKLVSTLDILTKIDMQEFMRVAESEINGILGILMDEDFIKLGLEEKIWHLREKIRNKKKMEALGDMVRNDLGSANVRKEVVRCMEAICIARYLVIYVHLKISHRFLMFLLGVEALNPKVLGLASIYTEEGFSNLLSRRIEVAKSCIAPFIELGETTYNRALRQLSEKLPQADLQGQGIVAQVYSNSSLREQDPLLGSTG
jgi:hypothetical protein